MTSQWCLTAVLQDPAHLSCGAVIPEFMFDSKNGHPLRINELRTTITQEDTESKIKTYYFPGLNNIIHTFNELSLNRT